MCGTAGTGKSSSAEAGSECNGGLNVFGFQARKIGKNLFSGISGS
jgi:hypothetical protein